MTVTRPQIIEKLVNLYGQLVSCTVEVDVEEIERHEPGDGFQHGLLIKTQPFEVTLDGGPDNQWEGERAFLSDYEVLGADQDARRAQRDLFLPALKQALEEDPTLGLDPQVFARITEGIEDDVFLEDAGAMSVATITVTVLYVAPTAAG
ncbi:hypothetical protein [Caulobacter sp. 1776]|uniref:hypothetical protein n=1 Tax=Caulobacter sp. 1776 TaxID=3156420 RepID=UPI0033996997